MCTSLQRMMKFFNYLPICLHALVIGAVAIVSLTNLVRLNFFRQMSGFEIRELFGVVFLGGRTNNFAIIQILGIRLKTYESRHTLFNNFSCMNGNSVLIKINPLPRERHLNFVKHAGLIILISVELLRERGYTFYSVCRSLSNREHIGFRAPLKCTNTGWYNECLLAFSRNGHPHIVPFIW